MKRWERLLPAVCALAAGLVYLPTLRAGLVWDDVVIQRVQMRYVRTLRDAFLPPLSLPPNARVFTRSFYRPVVTVSYLVDGSGRTPQPQDLPRRLHLSNVLYHMIATAGVALLAARLLRGRADAAWGTAAAGMLFALHPVHTESVCNVAGRTDVLATIGVLGAAIAAFRLADGGSRLWAVGSGAALLFGLLSKEVAAAGCLLIPALLWCFRRREPHPLPRGAWLPLLGSWLAAGLAYAALRARAGIEVQPPAPGGGLPLSSLPNVLAYYVLKSVFPWPPNPFAMAPPPAAVTGALFAVLVAAAALWVRRGRGDRVGPAVLAACFFVAVAPALPLAFALYAPTPVAERYLYLPTVFLSLGLGVGVSAAAAHAPARRPAQGAAALLLLLCAAGTWTQAKTWSDDVAFWNAVSRRGGNARSGVVLSNLGCAYFDRRRFDEAADAFQRALAPGVVHVDNSRERAAANLGAISVVQAVELMNAGRCAEAVASAGRALDLIEPTRRALLDSAMVFRNAAAALFVRVRCAVVSGLPFAESDVPRAREALRLARLLDPTDPETARLSASWQALEAALPSRTRP